MDFIDPFFKALGWDTGNEAGLLHDEREVIVEKGGSTVRSPPPTPKLTTWFTNFTGSQTKKRKSSRGGDLDSSGLRG